MARMSRLTRLHRRQEAHTTCRPEQCRVQACVAGALSCCLRSCASSVLPRSDSCASCATSIFPAQMLPPRAGGLFSCGHCSSCDRCHEAVARKHKRGRHPRCGLADMPQSIAAQSPAMRMSKPNREHQLLLRWHNPRSSHMLKWDDRQRHQRSSGWGARAHEVAIDGQHGTSHIGWRHRDPLAP
jgi:hypothetical protein